MNPCPFSIGDKRGFDQYPNYKGMRLEYRGVITENYTYVHTIDKPWLLFDNNNDPYQMRNLIEDSAYSELRNNLYEKILPRNVRRGIEELQKGQKQKQNENKNLYLTPSVRSSNEYYEYSGYRGSWIHWLPHY